MPQPSNSDHPEEVRLSNGIPVVFQNYSAPVAALYWWVRIGSADERPEEAGFAHFLEHMLFKDAAAKETGQASTGQIALEIESLGGDINAYTSFDQTVYHVTCAARHWERVLDAFGSMAKPQEFLKSDFEREREVILEELRKSEDSPGRQVFQTLFTSCFPKHPYGRPVIGFEKTLKAATVKRLEAFYQRSYIPANMGIVMVGPYDEARKRTLLAKLEKHFGSKVRPAPKKSAKREARTIDNPERKQVAVEVRDFDVKSPTVALGFRVPEISHVDVPALDVACQILGTGELSRFYQSLFYGKKLVTDISGGLYIPQDPGLAYFQADFEEPSKMLEVVEGWLEEVSRLAKEGPDAEELRRVIVNAESEKLYSLGSADGIAGRIGSLRFVMDDLDYDRKYVEKLREVDAEKIRDVMLRYFTPARLSVVVLMPKGRKGEVDKDGIRKIVLRTLPTPAAPEPVARKRMVGRRAGSADGAPRPILIERPSGIRVIVTERPKSQTFSLHAAVLGGLRLEVGAPLDSAEKDWGTSSLMSLTWTKGSRGQDGVEKTSLDIAKLIEGTAASLDGFSGRNTVGVQMMGLARDWGKLWPAFAETLLMPTFPTPELDLSRKVAEDSVRSIEDHTSRLCTKLFLETLFERHPYGKLPSGSLESLAGIDADKVRAYHRQWLRPERLMVSASGRVRWSEVEHCVQRLEEIFEAQRGGEARSLPDSLQDEPDLKGPRWVEKRLGREQLHILVGGLGTRFTSRDRHVLRVLQNILGGQSGRLFIELREKKSLAYTVAPTSLEGLEAGYVGTYIACSPSKKDEALAGIRTVLETIASKGPTVAELKRAREFHLGRRAMDFQSDSFIASHYGLEALYGIRDFDESDVARSIESVTAQQVKEFVRKYFIEPSQVTAVVG